DLLSALILEVRLNRARNRLDEATALIRSQADRPYLTPAALKSLAELAEEIGQVELAEELYNRIASQVPDGAGKHALAQFLGRRRKEALDVCETIWSSARNREPVAVAAIRLLFPSSTSPEPEAAQLKRVVGWLEQGVQQNPESPTFLIGLANLCERLQDYQK